MIYANPNTEGAVVNFKEKYDNFIGGEWVAPVKGQYFENKHQLQVKYLQKLLVLLQKILS